jgi:protease YdgD
MFAAFIRGLPLVAVLALAFTSSAHGAAIGLSGHRDAVDEHRYPWSSLGKLYNETGGSCSGAVIARNKILTAAHCVYNFRTRHYIPAEALHFLVGYRTGHYSAHARIASYEVGPGFDPQRYDQTSESDWAVLTVTQSLPAEIEPLRLRSELAPSGTKAVMAGYGQDRAFALTVDRDCELGDKYGAGLVLHTCRGNFGSSGAPILVRSGDGEMQIAGVQIASMQSGGTEQMVAVPAQAILRQEREAPREVKLVRAYVMPVFISPEGCPAGPSRDTPITLESIQDRLDFRPTIIDVQAEPDPGMEDAPNRLPVSTVAWLSGEPFALALF